MSAVERCAAGCQFREEPGGNPFWALPCLNVGTDELIIGPDSEGRSIIVVMCLAHIIALNPVKMSDGWPPVNREVAGDRKDTPIFVPPIRCVSCQRGGFEEAWDDWISRAIED